MHVTLMQANAIIYGRKELSIELKGVWILCLYDVVKRIFLFLKLN